MFAIIEWMGPSLVMDDDGSGNTLIFNTREEAEEYAQQEVQYPTIVEVPPEAVGFVSFS